jgi:hypothetical protein
MEDPPRPGQQDEAAADQQATQQVQRVQVGVALPAEKRGPQVPDVVGQEIESRDAPAQPSPQQVDRQRHAVHLGEEGDDEPGEGAERPPVTAGTRPREAECEDDEDQGVDDDE